MAIAFARVSIHSRSQGHSAVAGAAYRAGQTLYDERTGETHDYEGRDDVKHSEILLPEGADPKFADREFLWNEVERCEKRKDSQLAKDVILALPKELDLPHQIAMAKAFAHEHFVSKDLVADLAIHDHENGNPHAHVYVTLRRLEGNRFSKHKARDLNPGFANGKGGRGFVSEQDALGEQWRAFQNDYFERHKLDLTVDENLLFPQRHTGRISNGEAGYLAEENKLLQAAAREIIRNDPDYLLEVITNRYAVFTEKQLASIVFKATDSVDEYQETLAKLKGHKDVLPLGEKDGALHYTTRHIFNTEAKMIKQSRVLSGRAFHQASRAQVNATAKRKSLTDEQTKALRAMTLTKDLNILVGRAGTGKSYMLRATNEVWQQAGYDVMGVSVSGIATKGLQDSSGIPSSTMASFKYQLHNGRLQLDEESIVVVDEAGMMDLYDMALLVDHCQRAGTKLVLVGDPDQLQPIGPGAPFRALADTHGFAELTDIYRQKDKGDKQASIDLAKGFVRDALSHYRDKSALHMKNNPQEAMVSLIKEWQDSAAKDERHNSLILAHQNKHVDSLNGLAREALLKAGEIDQDAQALTVSRRVSNPDGLSTHLESRSIDIAAGDRLLFRKNDKSLGVVNGEFASVVNLSGNTLHCQLDDGRKLLFNTTQYNEFDYGYAATVHKSQGLTKDKVFVYVDGKGWDQHLSYVALTRHRDNVSLYAEKSTFPNQRSMERALSRRTDNDSTLGFAQSFAKRRGFTEPTIIKRLADKIDLSKDKALAFILQKNVIDLHRGLDR